MQLEFNFDSWQWVASQCLGLVSVFLIFWAFQSKAKSKTLFIQTIAISLGVVANAFLGNYVIAGLLSVQIVRNIAFLFLDKYDNKVPKWLSYFTLVFFLAAVVIVVVFTRQWWWDWILMVLSMLTVYGRWAKGIHKMRITALLFNSASIPNSIRFNNFMGLVMDIVIILSIIWFYIKRYRRRKNENN